MEIDNWYQAVINHLENLAITHTKIPNTKPKWVKNKYCLLVSPIMWFLLLSCLSTFCIFETLSVIKSLCLIWLKKVHPKLWYLKILLFLIWIILGKMVSDCTLIWSVEISMNNEHCSNNDHNKSFASQASFDNWEQMNLYSVLSKW